MFSQQFRQLIRRPKITKQQLSLHVQSPQNLKKACGFPDACVSVLISAHSGLKKAQLELKPEISCSVKAGLIYLAAFNCWNSKLLEIRNYGSHFTNGLFDSIANETADVLTDNILTSMIETLYSFRQSKVHFPVKTLFDVSSQQCDLRRAKYSNGNQSVHKHL